MPSKSTKPGFYAVANGRNNGIYTTWAECEAQTKGWPNAKYKKFPSRAEAQAFVSSSFPQSSSQAVIPTISQPRISQPTTSQPTFSQPPPAYTLTPTYPQRVPQIPSTDSTSKKRDHFGAQVTDTTGWDIVYSDGACKGNGKKNGLSTAGVGVWWGPNDERNLAERCPGDQTNNRAELIAILRVLETTPISKKPLLIRTDSQYCINCFRNWIINWKGNNWQTKEGKPVKNGGIIRCIASYMDIRAKVGQKVILEYVKGHSGDVGNDGADLMANQGAVKPECPERNWDILHNQLLLELSVGYSNPDFNLAVIFGLPEIIDNSADEPPSKIRKVSTPTHTSPSFSSASSSKSPFAASNPETSSFGSTSSLPQYSYSASQTPSSSQVVQASEVDFEDFADCLLDDDDLANEII